MVVWRLCKRRHAPRAFTGEGARRHGGRWNHPGTAIVYTSGTLSLATLELLVNVDPDMLPDDLVAVSAEIPEGLRVETIDARNLPRDWMGHPAPERLRELGTRWARSVTSPVLSVPSAVIPKERNYLLLPAHGDFRKIRTGAPEPFRLDPRIRRSG